jgi:hypothetical protein
MIHSLQTIRIDADTGFYQSTKSNSDLPEDPTLLSKFKCHPTIPCDIPKENADFDPLWYHVPDDLLPINWSCDWPNFRADWFLPYVDTTYSMGALDIMLKAYHRIPYPIKGVMYCTVNWPESSGLFEEELESGNHECIVFQDALGDYYFYYRFSQGGLGLEGDDYLSKFRTPRGTSVNDFVKQFRGAVNGVDMDLIPYEDGCSEKYVISCKEEEDLARLWKYARTHDGCACWGV